MHASGKKLDHLSSSARCLHGICKCDKVFHPFTGLGMWICLSPRCCWLDLPLLEGVSDLTQNMHFLRRSANTASLASCHLLPPDCSACAVLSAPSPEIFLMMVCMELPWSRLCLWYPLLPCHSRRRWLYPCLYSTGTSCSVHRHQKWQVFHNIF